MEIKSYLNSQRLLVEEALQRFFPPPAGPFAKHIDSMRYSLFGGGKRIRPILCLAAANTIAEDRQTSDNILPIACALECIHTYSLIHDDLPAMDNDELRRGKPTSHILFGEAHAILAGDALLTYAFELITDSSRGSLSAERRLKIAHSIAVAAGSFGMVGGQALDIEHENQDFPFEMLQTIHSSKTGALITASLHAGAIGAGANAEETEALLEYGKHVGLAFQIVDDLLNVTSTTEKLGKRAGSDKDLGKATYPVFFGIEETRKRALQAALKGRKALAVFGARGKTLDALAEYLILRSH